MRKLVCLLTNHTRSFSISLLETKKLVINRNVPFDEKISLYRKTISQNSATLPELIELGILMANSCSTTNKKEEFIECLKNLKEYCSSLNEETSKAIPEKSWNYLIQHFVKDFYFQSMAIYWYKKIMVRKIASPNIFTLKAVLPLFSENGEMDICEDIITKLYELQELNVFYYIHYLNSCIKNNNLDRAFVAVLEMKQKGIEPNLGVYIPLMKEATKTHNMKTGMDIYHMIKSSSLSSQQLSMSVVLFMLKMGYPKIAIEECEKMKLKGYMNVVSWTCLMQSYIQMNDIPKAITLLDEMKQSNVKPDAKTLSILITACADSNLFNEGKIIHQIALKHIVNIPIELYNSIINFYNKCGHPTIAIEECEKLKQKEKMDVVSYNCLMQSYIQMNDIPKTITLLDEMKKSNIDPNSTTFTILITACANSNLFNEGKKIHQRSLNYIQKPNIKLQNSIINFYNKCGHPTIAIEECEKLKQKGMMNIVSYNCLMQSYIQMNDIPKAITLLDEMIQSNVKPDTKTLSILITACADSNLFNEGKIIHQIALKHIVNIPIELYNSIINFYNKCGHPKIAIEEYEKMKHKGLSVVSWTCLMQSYIQMNDIPKAITLLDEMKRSNINPNSTTFTILITACADSNLFNEGKIIHQIALKHIENIPVKLATAIINFYNKCGHPTIAIEECEKLKQKGMMNIVSYNCLMQSYIQKNDISKAITLLDEMKQSNVKPDTKTLSILITACADTNLFNEGKIIHQIALKHIENIPIELYNSIINFYNKCGHPKIAIEEYEKMKHKGMSVVSWTCLMQSYIQMNDIPKAITLLDEMKQSNVKPDAKTLSILITACADSNLFNEGRIIHQIALKHIVNIPIELYNSIINFYNKCGHPTIAIEECEKLKQKGKMDVVSYNCLMQSYIQKNDISKAITLLDEMKQSNVKPDTKTLSILITACADTNLFNEGKIIHQIALKHIVNIPIELVTAIINFYNKCGHPTIAIEECEKLKQKEKMNIASYNCLMQSYIQMNDISKAITLLDEMRKSDINPNSTTFTILITACADSNLFNEGKIIHQIALKHIVNIPIELYNSIINFYNKCGHPTIAIEECEKLKQKEKMDVVSYNCLMQSYIQMNDIPKAITLLDEMRKSDINPNSTTFTILITACADSNLFNEGKIIHQITLKYIDNIPIELYNSIINFYNKCGHPTIAIEECEKLKQKGMMDVVSYNCLIQSCIQMNDTPKAITLLDEMKKSDINPNSTTFTILITACADSNLFNEGKIIHQIALKHIENIPIELATAIINFYNKCGHPTIAIEECEKLKQKGMMNIVSYNCLIQSYVNYNINQVMEVLEEMKQNFDPDIITYMILLSGCGEYVSVDIGKNIIAEIRSRWMELPEEIVSVMIYFYSRIGENEMAEQLFSNLKKKNESHTLSIITYNNMLACYAHHGKANEAKQLFMEMNRKTNINEQSFTILLNAFSHCGMVVDAMKLFEQYKHDFCKEPSLIMTCAMLDTFARAGRFDEAEHLINGRMDFKLWNTVMGGCRKFNNVELGEKVFKILLSIDQNQASPYILMSNIYTYHKMNDKANYIRRLMKKNGIKKIPGIVYHEHEGKVFKFVSGATDYERYPEIEIMRNEIYRRIIEAGFIPDTRWVTNTKLLSEEEKIDNLCKHAEKTAIAHAFVLNPNTKRIVLTKNLRVCNDCHNATEYISKVMNVEIIVRDANRYHHFKDGKCSCDSFW